MVRKGEPWGRPAAGPADLEAHGDDADLASVAAGNPGRRIRFSPAPASDLARAVGASGSPPEPEAEAVELPLDGLMVVVGGVDGEHPARPILAVNMAVLGVPPDRLRPWHRRHPCRVEVDGRVAFEGRATTVVVASGQFLRGLDLVPRGHPGDGRAEVQVYAMAPAARAPMRRRLAGGLHVPHPGIRQLTGRAVRATFATSRPLEVDGRPRPATPAISVEVAPEALLLLV